MKIAIWFDVNIIFQDPTDSISECLLVVCLCAFFPKRCVFWLVLYHLICSIYAMWNNTVEMSDVSNRLTGCVSERGYFKFRTQWVFLLFFLLYFCRFFCVYVSIQIYSMGFISSDCCFADRIVWKVCEYVCVCVVMNSNKIGVFCQKSTCSISISTHT